MGKKIIPGSTKISKNHREKNKQKQKQQQLNSLIKVLRPKVYITDSSSFKSLVQELTGNGNGSSNTALPSPTSSPPIYPQTDVDDSKISSISILDDIDHEDLVGAEIDPDQISSSCMEVVSDTSLDSFDPCNSYYQASYSSLLEEELKKNDTIYDLISLEDTTTSVEYLLMNQEKADLCGNQDLESWLLDTEPHARNHNVSAQIQREISIYDYEVCGLLI